VTARHELGFFVCRNVASKCDIVSYLASFEQNSMRSWLVTMRPIKGGAPPVGSAQAGFDKGWVGVFKSVHANKATRTQATHPSVEIHV
jgi:hypothetical protein